MDRGNLTGYRPWGLKEMDMTERLTLNNTYDRNIIIIKWLN